MPKISRHSGGFSLVELMVGVVIAIIASIIMFQVFAFSERQKRVVTGASDAQVNGVLALDMLEREIKGAGFGGGTNPLLSNCTNTFTYYDSGAGGTTPGPFSMSMTQPVVLVDHAGAEVAADEIVIHGSGSNFSGNYLLPQSCLSDGMPQSSSELKVASTYGFDTCELMMVVQTSDYSRTDPDGKAGNCTLMQVTQVQSSSLHIQHNPSSSGPTYNPKVSYQNDHGWPAYHASSAGCEASAVCVQQKGSSGDELRFSVRKQANGQRELVMIKAGVTSAIAPQIMDVQAQYGLVATAAGAPVWQAATGSWAGTAPLSAAQVKQIKAIRLALVARSGEFEKPADGVTCGATTSAPAISSWGTTFDTSAWPTSTTDPSQDWRCYRYKVFETVVPLRNVIWSAT